MACSVRSPYFLSGNRPPAPAAAAPASLARRASLEHQLAPLTGQARDELKRKEDEMERRHAQVQRQLAEEQRQLTEEIVRRSGGGAAAVGAGPDLRGKAGADPA